MVKIITKELLAKEAPFATVADQSFELNKHLRIVEQGRDRTVVEFIGTDDFGSQWYDRQRYEVDAGRESEPLLYQPLYLETTDPSFPRNVTVYRVGPGAVVFEEIYEGGEVKFVTVGESNYSVQMHHYAVGLEYNKDLVMFNEMWELPIIERQAGVAFNALKNHIHLNPFIAYSYGSANQTAASSVGSSLPEKYLRTLEDAITNSVNDTTNPRRGPYWLLTNTSNLFTWERALNRVPQQGFDLQSSAMNMIQGIIAYNGWTGTRGKKSVTYDGVASNKAYLIDVGNRMRNQRSYIKQDLQSTMGNPDVSRFILEQVIWDTYFTMYVDIPACAEEVTLPTS